MEKYKVIKIIRNENMFILKLKNKQGTILEKDLWLTKKYIINILAGQGLPVDKLSEEQILKCYSNCFLEAEVEIRKKGNTFTANKFTKFVTLDDGSTWIKPIPGKSYPVYWEGCYLNYEKEVHFDFYEKVLDKIDEIIYNRPH